MSIPLLKTKTNIPTGVSRVLKRTQLQDKLNAGLAGKLTLLSAPPGFGKTTLLTSWAGILSPAPGLGFPG